MVCKILAQIFGYTNELKMVLINFYILLNTYEYSIKYYCIMYILRVKHVLLMKYERYYNNKYAYIL